MSALSDLLRQSLLFPVLQSIHILGLVVLVGTISLIDFRLLGLAIRGFKVSELTSQLAPWTTAGLLTVLATGPLLFGADVTRYLINPAFVLKMALLATALLVHFTLHHRATSEDRRMSHTLRRVAAAVSLILWIGVVLAGRAVADFDIHVVRTELR